MKILNLASIKTFSNITQNRTISQKPVSFKGFKYCTSDIFQRQSKTFDVKISDTKGTPINATIAEERLFDTELYGKNPKKFTLSTGSKEIGYAIMGDAKDGGSVYLRELYTEENLRRHYKSAGTELLRAVVKESKKRGFGGCVSVTASNCPPPFVFYYKNNFKVSKGASVNNAAIDYAARTNTPVYRVLPEHLSALPMELDENGANAFLKNKRLYEQRNFETFLTEEINGKKIQANLIEAPYKNEQYFQIIAPDTKNNKQKFIAKILIEENSNGEKYIKLTDINDCYALASEMNFAQKALRILGEKMGAQDVVMTKEYSERDF